MKARNKSHDTWLLEGHDDGGMFDDDDLCDKQISAGEDITYDDLITQVQQALERHGLDIDGLKINEPRYQRLEAALTDVVDAVIAESWSV